MRLRTCSGRCNPGRLTSPVTKCAVKHYQSRYKGLPTTSSRAKTISILSLCLSRFCQRDTCSRSLQAHYVRGKVSGRMPSRCRRRNGHMWGTAGAVDLFPSRVGAIDRRRARESRPRRCFVTFGGSQILGNAKEIMLTVSGLGIAAVQEVQRRLQCQTAAAAGLQCSNMPIEVRSQKVIRFRNS